MAKGIYTLRFSYSEENHDEMREMLMRTYFISDNVEIHDGIRTIDGERIVRLVSDEMEDIINAFRAASLICHGFIYDVSIQTPVENIIKGIL